MSRPRGFQRIAGRAEPKKWEIVNMRIVGRACDRWLESRGLPLNTGGLRAIIQQQSSEAIASREQREAAAARRRARYLDRAVDDLSVEQ